MLYHCDINQIYMKIRAKQIIVIILWLKHTFKGLSLNFFPSFLC